MPVTPWYYHQHHPIKSKKLSLKKSLSLHVNMHKAKIIIVKNRRRITYFLGATMHLYNWLCPSVCRVTHSFDDPHVAPYWPTWPCFCNKTIYTPPKSQTGGQARNSKKSLAVCYGYGRTDRRTDGRTDLHGKF